MVATLAIGTAISGCGTPVLPSIALPPSASFGATSTASVDASVPQSSAASPSIGTAELRPISDAPLADPGLRGIAATPAGFVIDGIGREAATQFVLSGSADGRTWSRLDARSFGTAFTDIVAGPLGWVADQQVPTSEGVGVGTVLWFSTDGRSWQRVPDQAGLGESFAGPLSAGPLGFAMIGQVVVSGTSIPALWTSPDGRVWSEVESVRDAGLDRIVITPRAFVGVRTGRNGATPSIWISTDGSRWTSPATVNDSPIGVDGTSITTPVEIGPALLVVRGASEDRSISVWLGTLEPVPGGTIISWERQPGGDGLLLGAAVVTATTVSDGVALFGYDRSSLAPLVWMSADGKAWRRMELAVGTFGGGVPDLIVRGAHSVVAVGVAFGSDAEGTVARVWRTDDGIDWAPVTGELLGPQPTQPAVSCPVSRPGTVEGLLEMDRSLLVPCFGRDPLTIDGYVAGCGGCGGTSGSSGSPSWLLDPLGYSAFWLAGTFTPAETGGGGLGVWIDPARPVIVPPEGTHVAVTGHFDDPAATTCHLVPLVAIGVALPNPADAVATCRRSFVASGIRVVKP
jgi:hypothetical protein